MHKHTSKSTHAKAEAAEHRAHTPPFLSGRNVEVFHVSHEHEEAQVTEHRREAHGLQQRTAAGKGGGGAGAGAGAGTATRGDG